MDWHKSNSKTIEFIDAVRCEPLLWDADHADYRDKNKRKCAWQDISTAYDLTIEESIKKFKNLRTYAKREKKIMKMTGLESADRSWFAYKSMEFIVGSDSKTEREYYELDEPLQPTVTIQIKQEANPFYDDSITDNTGSESNLKTSTIVQKTSSSDPKLLHLETTESMQRKSVKRCKRKKSESEDSLMSDEIPASTSRFSKHNSAEDKNDELIYFSKYITAQLRKLPVVNALKCQNEIQGIITKERMQVLLTSNCTSESITNTYNDDLAAEDPIPSAPDIDNKSSNL